MFDWLIDWTWVWHGINIAHHSNAEGKVMVIVYSFDCLIDSLYFKIQPRGKYSENMTQGWAAANTSPKPSHSLHLRIISTLQPFTMPSAPLWLCCHAHYSPSFIHLFTLCIITSYNYVSFYFT